MITHASARCCWCQSPLQRETDKSPWLCWHYACLKRIEPWCLTLGERDGRGRVKKAPNGDTLIRQWLYAPTPRQVEWHEAVYRRSTTRLLVGGHAGPGKSRWMRATLYRLALQVPGFHALLLRRTHKDLEQSHLRFVPKEVADLQGTWKISDKVIEFQHPKGETSIIRMGHLEDSGALQNYLSSEYDAIAPDELVTFDKHEMLELFSRARSTNEHLYALRGGHRYLGLNEEGDWEEMETDGSIVLASTNPGGRGGHWVKEFFIDHNPDPAEHPNYQPELWAFHSAVLRDNPYIKRAYISTLQDLPEIRRRQLLHGDWDAFEGQFFEMFSARTHARTVAPFPGAEWVEAFDWGYGSWSCWGAFFGLADNHWHCAKAIKFKKTEPPEAATLIRACRRELGYEQPRYAVADPKIFSEDRGESIAETFRRHGVLFQRATNTRSDAQREMGWPRLAAWFRFDPRTATQFDEQRAPLNGIPWLTFDPEECKYLLRTIPALMMDEHNPEDVDTSMDDHGADMCRYFVMSRPPIGKTPERPTPPPLVPGSWGWWRRHHARVEARASAIA